MWNTETRHIGQLPRKEKVCRDDGKTRLCAEQKSVQISSNIVRKLTRGGDFIMDACAGTMLTVKACLILPCHRGFFIGYNIDADCFHKATSYLVLVLDRQAVNFDSNIRVSDEVEMACKVYVAAEGRKRLR